VWIVEEFHGEILSVDKVVYARTQGLNFGWYLDTPIIIKAHVEYNELCREK